MKNFTFRWSTYKRLKYIKDTENFFTHIQDYLKWCSRNWRMWEAYEGLTLWGQVKDRDHKFNTWLEYQYSEVQG